MRGDKGWLDPATSPLILIPCIVLGILLGLGANLIGRGGITMTGVVTVSLLIYLFGYVIDGLLAGASPMPTNTKFPLLSLLCGTLLGLAWLAYKILTA